MSSPSVCKSLPLPGKKPDSKCWCAECRKKYDSERFQRTKDKKNIQVKERRYSTYDWVRGLKNSPCVDCGGTFHFAAMQYDHVDDNKVDNVSSLIAQGASRKRIAAEIAKCELVCANCHAIRTYNRVPRV